jgi:hypothetical protein
MTGGGFDANTVQGLVSGAAKSGSALPANPQGDTRLAALESALAATHDVQPAPVFSADAIPVPRPKPQSTPAAAILAEVAVPKPVLTTAKSATPQPALTRILHAKS